VQFFPARSTVRNRSQVDDRMHGLKPGADFVTGIDAQNLMAVLPQSAQQVRPNETRSARDGNFHLASSTLR
jgi:hypothetical protein